MIGKKLINATNRSVYEIDLYESTPPSAQISADKLEISCKNDTVFFVDHSAVRKASATWSWSFPGGNPSSSNLDRELTRLKNLQSISHYYDSAREFAKIVSRQNQKEHCNSHVIVTGGGPGIMEAANRGAFDADCKSIGLNISLPNEQHPNAYITPGLCFKFNYFALRKFHFVMRSVAAVFFPGGFGTFDELFELLTLRQTGMKTEIPIILFGRDYWSKVINFQFLSDHGLISDEHMNLFQYADSASEAWDIIKQ